MSIYALLKDLLEVPRFEKFSKVKKSGKRRVIGKPNNAMRLLHQRIVRKLRSLDLNYLSAHGGVKGRSILTNAYEHRSSQYFYFIDFYDAYGSVPLEGLAHLLSARIPEWGTPAEILSFLSLYCSLNLRPGKGLVQGAPASLDLFNFYCELMVDRQIRDICYDGDTYYSRYVDDLAISNLVRPIPAGLRRKIRRVLAKAGLSVNERKSHHLDREKAGSPGQIRQVVITGIALEGPPRFGVSLPWKFLRALEEALDDVLGKPALFKAKIRSLRGSIGHFRLVERNLRHNSATRRIARKIAAFQAQFPHHSSR